MILAIIFGFVSTLLIILGPEMIKMFLPTTDPEQVESVMFGIEYIKIIGYGAIVFLSSFMIATFFRSVGRHHLLQVLLVLS